MTYFKPGTEVKISDRRRQKLSREAGVILPETGTVVRASAYEEGFIVKVGGRDLFFDARDLTDGSA